MNGDSHQCRALSELVTATRNLRATSASQLTVLGQLRRGEPELPRRGLSNSILKIRVGPEKIIISLPENIIKNHICTIFITNI